MKNTWLVAVREFSHRVRTRGFLIASLGVPLVMVLVWGGSGLLNFGTDRSVEGAEPEPPVGAEAGLDGKTGYVDPGGLVRSIPAGVPENLFQAYPDIDAAEQALVVGEIVAYYYIPPDFPETKSVRRVSDSFPFTPPVDSRYFDALLVSSLFPGASQQELARLRYPLGFPKHRFVVVDAQEPASSPESGESPASGDEAQITGVSMVPMLVTVVMIIPLFTSGGYLIQSLAQEKGNRIMEILLVSLRPWQLLAGKLVGLGALTLVQYAIWIAIGGTALALAGQNVAGILAGINLTLQDVIYILLFALGGYTIYSAFMAGVGALAPSLEGGRSWVLLIAVPMTFPIYFWVGIVSNPEGLLAVSLSLIPFTAPVAMLMRMTSSAVPGWQIALSLFLLYLTAAGTIWLMARLFKVQTLLSGEAISFRRIWSVLTTPG